MVFDKIPIETEYGEPATLQLYLKERNEENLLDTTFPLILVVPGGGYGFVSEREAEPVALAFAARGYSTAVLWYNVFPAHYPQQLVELAKSFAFLRRNAERFCLDPARFAVCGFSAGGHLAASLGVHWNKPFLQKLAGATAEELRPDRMILCYPVVTSKEEFCHGNSFKRLLGENPDPEERKLNCIEEQITPSFPPTFLWDTTTDATLTRENNLALITALFRNAIPCEIHAYGCGPHGLSVADRTVPAPPPKPGKPLRNYNIPHVHGWVQLCDEWLNLPL